MPTPAPADLAQAPGGGPFSRLVSRRAAARIARAAQKRRIAPAVLTVLSLGVGCLVSAAVVAASAPVAEHRIWAWPVGLLALLGWQLAYAFELAAGGPVSAAAERLALLCHVAVQVSLVAAIAATAKAQVHSTPVWLLAAFAGSWMISLVAPAVAGAKVARVVRDHGAVILLAGLVLTVAPQWSVWFAGAFTLINAALLAAEMIHSARETL